MADRDRYGLILRRVWVDEAFLSWSAPTPSAQFLWFYLLTTPRAGSIPGVYTLSLYETAKRLGWSIEDTRRVFAEITEQDRAVYDERTELIYLPNAIALDPPRNVNVLKSWRRQWAELPNCDLKRRIETDFAAYFATGTAGLSEAWAALNSKQVRTDKQLPPFGSGTGDPNSRNSFVDSGSKSESQPEIQTAETLSATATGNGSVSDLSGGVQRGATRADLVVAEVVRRTDLFPGADARDLETWARGLLRDPDLHLPPTAQLWPYVRAALRKLSSKVAADPGTKNGTRLGFVQSAAFGLVNDDKANGWSSGRTDGREGVCAPHRGRERPSPEQAADDFAANAAKEVEEADRRRAAEHRARGKGGESHLGDILGGGR